jgi:hypothetical protein
MDGARFDKVIGTAFERECAAIPLPTPPGSGFVRALPVFDAGGKAGGGSAGGLHVMRPGLRTAVLSAALTAACVLPLLAGAVVAGTPRPLAAELSASLPGDSGKRFTAFMLAAGASLRSSD